MLLLCMKSKVFHHTEHLLLLHFFRQVLRLILKKCLTCKLMQYTHYKKSHFDKNLTQHLQWNLPWDHEDIQVAWKSQDKKVQRTFNQKSFDCVFFDCKCYCPNIYSFGPGKGFKLSADFIPWSILSSRSFLLI